VPRPRQGRRQGRRAPGPAREHPDPRRDEIQSLRRGDGRHDRAGIIGINRSPSCGVDTTTVGNEEVKGEGVFIERLRTSLEAKGFYLNLAGTKVSQIDEALRSIRAMVEKSEATYAKAAGRALSSEFRDA
jgi:hypothetical protein